MLTVLMATRNGAGWIGKSLDSLCALAPPTGGWRLIIVNNGSTDETGQILARYAERLPLCIVHSTRPGKNAALNLGLAHAEGELIAFTDDDVIVDPQWLVHLAGAAAAEPEYAIFGGAIRPEWPHEPAPWILDLVPLGLTYSLTPALQRGACTPSAVWGPNMAVRARVFRAGPRFDESIGPDDSSGYAMGSETSFTRRLAVRGERCFHVPEALVGHIIRPTQMTRDFALRRAYRGGRGKGLLAQELEPTLDVAGVPRYFLRQAAQAAAGYGAARLRRDPAAAFKAAWQWHYAVGCIQGARAVAVTAAASRAPMPRDAPIQSAQALA